MDKTRRQVIFDHVPDLVWAFVYYDRKEDEDLSRESIAEAFLSKEVTPKEVADFFLSELETWMRSLR